MGYRAFGPTEYNYVASGPVLTSHTADGDTLSHWTFATDLDDSVGTALLAGTYVETTQNGNDKALLAGDSVFYTNLPGASYTGLHGAMSFGMLIRIDALPASYCGIFSIQPLGGGVGAANNIVFNFRLQSDGTLLWVQENGSKVASTQAIPLSPPVGEWCWIGASRNAAGTAITVAVNDDELSYSGLTQGSDGGNADILIATDWDSRTLQCAIKSVILKDVESDLATLRAQTGI